MKVLNRIFISIIFLLLIHSNLWASDYLPEINELSKIVEKCVQRRDTNHHIFHGCIDWHSSVHGNWALIYSSKANNKIPTKIFSILNHSNIQTELELLKSNEPLLRSFEMPYGRAWFLQLARDSETMFNNYEMRDAANYVYSSLMEYAKSSGGDFVSSRYDNASWYIYQLYQWAEHIRNDMDKKLLRKLAISRINKVQNWPKLSQNTGFFEPKSLALLLLETISGNRDLVNKIEKEINKDGLKPKKMPFSTSHQGGINYSRAWGIWALYNLTQDEKYKASWEEHMGYMIKNINNWKDDYRQYGHWVAQFGLYSYRNLVKP